MPGIKALRKIQMGRETTAGVATAATSLWRGLGTIEDQREVKFVEEDIGYISGVDRSYVPKLFGVLEMDSVEATFEQALHVFEAGIKSVGNGVVDTGGSGKVYTYTFPTTSKNTITAYTLEGGDDQEAERIEYAFVQEFTLDGKGGEALMIKSTWAGRQVTVNPFTGGIVLPEVEDILFSKGKLFIDAVSGTMGTTQVSNSFLGMALKVNTGWVPKWTGDGQLYFSFAKLTTPEILLDITFEHDGSSAAEKVNWRNKTPRQIRVLFEGNALTTAGTYDYKSLIIDLAGKWEKFSKLDEEDGNDIVTGTFRARYNPTCAKFAQIVVVNELASVP